MSETWQLTHRPRRPGTPTSLRGNLKRSVKPASAVAIWSLVLPAVVASVGILAVSCSSSPNPAVISADRTVQETPCLQHAGPARCYEVTETWMQERYQLERALRVRLEKMEASPSPFQEFGK